MGIGDKNWRPCYNDEAEAIPPFSVARVSGTVNGDDGFTYWKLKKYDGLPGVIVVTSRIAIPANSFGGAATLDDDIYASIDPTSNPAAGEVYGPVEGEWFIGPSGTGFTVQGEALAGSDPLRAQFYRGVNSQNIDDGGGGTSSGCGCCNCLKCVNLCDLNVDDVVTECGECPNGATKKYTATVADGSGWLMTGGVTLTHVIGGCVWETAEFDITIDGVTGTYKWVLTQAGAGSTLVLTHVGGYADVVGVEITYTATTTSGQAWSCVCRSKMELTTNREMIPFDSGLVCEVCLHPQETATALDPTKCRSICYSADIAGITGGDPSANSLNGHFDFVAFGVGVGLDGDVCSCVAWYSDRDETEPAQWVYVPFGDLTGGELSFQFGSDVFGPCTVIYAQSSGDTCVSDELEFVFDSLRNCSAASYPYDEDSFPPTIALMKTDCSYANQNGCGSPAGDGCRGAGTHTWDGEQWGTVGSCENTGCAGSCESFPPDRDGAYIGEVVVVECTCA